MEHKLKFGFGVVALSVPVIALYLGLAAPSPATRFLPGVPVNWMTIVAGLGSFLLGWAAIATWSFTDSAGQPEPRNSRPVASQLENLGGLSCDLGLN